MVLIYTGFMTVVSDAGVGAAVVQMEDIDETGMSTAFFMATGLGLLMGALGVAMAPVAESFFSQPGLAPVMVAMSVTVLFVGATVVPYARLRRQLRFPAIAVTDVCATLGSGVIGVWLAVAGAGVWALVAQSVASAVIRWIATVGFDRWVPRLRWSSVAARTLARYSAPILGSGSLNYWIRNGDNLMVGRFLGAASLGYYSQAYRVMMLPVFLITSVINPVLHPVLARMQNDLAGMRRLYLQTLEVMAAVSFLAAVGLGGCADVIIEALFGPGWERAVPILQILAASTIVQPLVSTSGSVLMSRNQPGLFLRLGILSAIAMLGAMAAGLPFGAVGVAAGFLVSYMVVVAPVTSFFVLRSLGIRAGALASAMLRPGLVAAVAALTLVATRWALSGQSAWPVLIACIVATGLVAAPMGIGLYRVTITQLLSLRRSPRAEESPGPG
jgi:PST family polysaccharide transporter